MMKLHKRHCLYGNYLDNDLRRETILDKFDMWEDTMGIRLTSISTPVIGASWEYTNKGNEINLQGLCLNHKIKVFISSICGEDKYDSVRIKLKEEIEKTGLADVYIFEGEGASTISAGNHYSWELEDCDICLFLIDNADGIRPGVQAEIDIVNKQNIKALYYFCDETTKEKTSLEQSLMGAQFAKSKTVHKFEDLSKDGAKDLIDDILKIYHYYCIGKIDVNIKDGDAQGVDLAGIENIQFATTPKAVLKNIDKCKEYILNLVLDGSYRKDSDVQEKTSEIDEWCTQFLPIMFEGKSIKQFNLGMYLDVLQEEQAAVYFGVVNLRWHAIQEYYMGNIEKCKSYLEEALAFAKENNQPAWVIKDILIDIRNMHWTLCTLKNKFFEPEAQKELSESGEELYYPVLDRINESLYEKYIEGLYKKKTESPYTITIGGNLESYGELLASYFVIAMYNGSLTHLLLYYEKIRNLLFYLCCKYDDWNLRRDLYKYVIYSGKEKEIKGIQNSYPEVLNNLTATDAEKIIEFTNNHAIKYERFNSQLLALGAVGYYLDEPCFKKYETILLQEIREWFDNDILISNPAQSIFKCLSGISHRISQDTIAEICCLFIEKHFSRWYTDLFGFISKHVDLNKMSKQTAEKLISHILEVFENEKERDQVKYAPAFIHVLRNQDIELTEELDRKTSKYFPQYYNGVYKLETILNDQDELLRFVKEYAAQVKSNTENQGKGGVYFGRATRDIATLRSIFLGKEFDCDAETMRDIISASANTLLTSKESISIKLDAIALLCCIVIRFPEDYKANQEIYHELYDKKQEIETADHSIMSSNIDGIALKIGLQFLYTSMGKDTYAELLGLFPYIQNDVATTIAVSNLIVEYLESNDTVVLPNKTEIIILQNVLQWIRSENLDIRWLAVRILLMLIRNTENQAIINQQLVKSVNEDCFYIKNLIMRQIINIPGIDDETRDYIFSKCENDSNYVVRIVCEEMKQKKS